METENALWKRRAVVVKSAKHFDTKIKWFVLLMNELFISLFVCLFVYFHFGNCLTVKSKYDMQ